MALKLILEVLTVVFAMLGFLGTIRWLFERLFSSKNLCIAIEILTQRDAETAEVLIRDALFRCLSFPSARIVLLVDVSLWENEQLKKLAKMYGVCCYPILKNESGN